MPISQELLAIRKKLGIPLELVGDPKPAKDPFKLLPKTHALRNPPKPKDLPKAVGMRVTKRV